MAQTQIKKIKRVIAIVVLCGVFIFAAKLITGSNPSINFPSIEKAHAATMWEYQCIDTMKTSRDKARVWADRGDLDHLISREMKAIKGMGANCVALNTPYDAEFEPYLRKWVDAARDHKLKIWFRGNFSSWEGWFDYPKGMTSEQLFEKTEAFILDNPDLFRDGDVFTPAPEGENGGPFEQVEKDEHEAFRVFLIKEHEVAKRAFEKIGKNVEVNWLSMNGGLAKRMFDQPTVDALGKVVNLDHYIATSPEMGEFITYFADKYGAKTVIGEFGAPIPQINGDMTEDQQAAFIDELFYELYKNREHVIGVNYWVLFDSSTELYNKDFTPRKAVDVVEKYFKPLIIEGVVSDKRGKKLKDVRVHSVNGHETVLSDKNGRFTLYFPNTSGDVKISVDHTDYTAQSQTLSLVENKPVSHKIKLEKKHKSFFDGLWDILK